MQRARHQFGELADAMLQMHHQIARLKFFKSTFGRSGCCAAQRALARLRPAPAKYFCVRQQVQALFRSAIGLRLQAQHPSLG